MTPTISPVTAIPHSSPVLSVPPMTADEFFRKHENDRVELVRGVVKEMPMPGGEHGYICVKFSRYLDEFAERHELGRVLGNDTFVRIPGDPETVRGADVLFLSYVRWPKERKIPRGVLEIAPELVVEVRSPSDTWTEVFGKVVDYLRAGVSVVVLVNPMRQAIGVYRDRIEDEEQIGIEQDLVLPDVLPGFSMPLRKLFE